MKVLLIGNPNVGKSAVFSQLTGVKVMCSNYPGTTVEYSKGFMSYDNKDIEIIDVPGTYRLNPECEAERVAVDMINEGDILINVVDATNLERNLNLTLQLFSFKKPMILALNMWDETKHKGINIDIEKLSQKLSIPVIATSGISGEGLLELRDSCMKKAKIPEINVTSQNRWELIGNIINEVQDVRHKHHTVMEILQDISIHNIFGFPLALFTLFLIFKAIISLGDFLIQGMSWLFNLIYTPFILWLSNILHNNSFLHEILIGNIEFVPIDYETAMGVLTTGVFLAFGLVLPYIVLFYIVLGFLEDLGYLPRMAILFDRMMHKIGVHGYSIVPMLLGCGCNVPGLLAIRNLETRRERFITGVLIASTLPCMAQTAVMIQSLGKRGLIYIFILFTTLFLVWLTLGLILKHSVKGKTPTLLMEIPPYRLPNFKVQMKKLGMRLQNFLKEAVPYVLLGILLINILSATGIINIIGNIFSPIIKGLLGLPNEMVSSLIIGIVRKDAAIAILEPLNLTNTQMITAAVVLVLYFPCVATFVVFLKELGIIDTLKTFVILFITTICVGSIFNFVLNITSPIMFWIFEVIIILLLFNLKSIKRKIQKRVLSSNKSSDSNMIN